jgi:hypothetical protein
VLNFAFHVSKILGYININVTGEPQMGEDLTSNKPNLSRKGKGLEKE